MCVHLQCHRLIFQRFVTSTFTLIGHLVTMFLLPRIIALISLCTIVAFADYILMNPSSEYEEIMARVHEKIYLSKVSQTIIQCGWSIRGVFPLCVDLVQIDLQLLFRSCYIIFLILR